MKLLFVALLAIVATAESLHCEPHSSFKIGCNSCRCTNDGKDALCTRKICNPRIWNEDGSRKYVATKLTDQQEFDESEQPCQPLSAHIDYCNTCRCSSDGMSMACTTIVNCDPKDGSQKYGTNANFAEESEEDQEDE